MQRTAKRDLTAGSLPATLFGLAWPIAVGTILHASYSLWDAYWLGKVSKEVLAAPAASMPFQFFGIAFGMGFASAGTALVAQHTGAGNHRQADHAAGQTILILCGLITALALPIALFAPQLFALFRVPSEVQPQGLSYLRIVMAGMPLMAFAMSYGSVLRALGDTLTVVIIGLIANAANVVLDPILIRGWGPIPSLGATGAALATVNARLLEAVACYYFLRRGRAGLHIKLSDLKPDWPVIRRTLSVGLPAAIANSSNSVGFAVYTAMVNSLGTVVMGATFIGFRIIHFFRVPAESMAMAAAPVVGQALGAGKPQLARRAVWASTMGVAAAMFLPFLLLTLGGRTVAALFVDDAGVVAEARRFFYLVPLSSYCFGVLMVLMAAFYGSGHTRPVMALSLIRLWGLRIPIAYVLAFKCGMGSLGLYTGMATANIVAAGLAVSLFVKGGWQSAIVETRRSDEAAGAGSAEPQDAGAPPGKHEAV